MYSRRSSENVKSWEKWEVIYFKSWVRKSTMLFEGSQASPSLLIRGSVKVKTL
jgi:hypothetical protein